jgi:putative protease
VNEIEIGIVRHYFDKISVAAIDLTEGNLAVGDTVHIKGHTSDFTETVDSIQIEHAKVPQATKGQSIGIKVVQKAREHDKVFKVVA